MNDLTLGAGFPRHSYEDWRALAESTLGGADFERRLVTRTYDGIAIEPLYTAGHASAVPVPVADGAAWSVAQRVSHPDPARAAGLIREEIDGGAAAVVLRIAAPERPHGVAIAGSQDLDTVLGAVDLAGTPVRLDAGSQGLGMAALLAVHLVSRGIPPSNHRCSLGIDPYAGLIDGAPDARHPDAIAARAAGAVAAGFAAPVFTIDAHRLHAAGASEAQELAGALGMGVHLLRRLEAAGITLEAAHAAIGFVFAADADIFLTMAKLRAWPLLWGRVLEACGVEAAPARPLATTASRMLCARDPAVNMLRATAAVFAAAAGGAGAITVAPYTDALGEPDALARRMARNTQLILAQESHIARVGDPASGSWYADTLTGALAERAWQAFSTIEALGGFVAALEMGHVQSGIMQVAALRGRDIAARKLALTGVSEFPDLAEKPAGVEPPAAQAHRTPAAATVADWNGAVAAAAMGKLATAGDGAPPVTPLPRIRLAAPFEALRTLSDRALADTGARPRVFVAGIGALADHAARAGFVRTAFEAGGIEPVSGDASDFAGSGAAIACLCGSDAAYEEHAAGVAAALRGAGARRIYLAGRPNEALVAAGIDTFVHAGADIVDILAAAHAYCAGAAGGETP
jgi:methylmalonyl-CoA mutase